MVPATAILSLLMAGGLWAQRTWPARPALVLPWPAAVIALALAIETCYLAGGPPFPFVPMRSGHEQATSLSSPVTAGMFFWLGCALALAAARTRMKLAQAIALAVFLLAILNLAGYLFRDTLLFRFLPGRGTSVLTTAQVILLSLGILFAHPRDGLMAAVTGELPSARISRRLLVLAFVVPVGTGALAAMAARAGLYDSGTALPLFVWSLVVLFMMIIWRFAIGLAAVDAARSHAERELHAALGTLRAEHDRKDVFFATLAHELRNPLAPVGAAAEVLRLGGAARPEERQRIGNVIAAQVGQIVALVDDLMDVERVSHGRIALDRAVLDMRDVIAGSLDQVQDLMRRRRHDCRVVLPGGPAHVCGDHKRLVQIVSNLLNNAAKYTPPGGTIVLTLAAGPRQVEVIVEDNGVGIDAGLLQRLFERYSQAALTSDRAEGGLGLGLWLAQRLAELHGGTIRAASAGPGQGSTFTLALPRADQTAGCGPVEH
nr:HAMP domain-containing sensor histidine kinase [Pseudoduganella dura]